MDRLKVMAVFVQVAERRSFAAAARRLGLSAPAVSRAIAALEDRLGARLVTRTTRSVRLTEAGQRYYEDCRRILADIEEADAAAAGAHGELRGQLLVTASVLFGRLFVLPIVMRFLDDHPGVAIRTLFVDRVVNLVEEGVDVAVRIGELPSSTLRAQQVGSVRRIVCASPEYLARHGVPATPDELRQHRIVAAGASLGSTEWRFAAGDASVAVALQPSLVTTNNGEALDAAVAGWGLTRVLSYQAAAALAAGRLRIVLAEFEPAPLPIHVVHGEGRRASAKLRAFVDRAVRELREHPALSGDARPRRDGAASSG